MSESVSVEPGGDIETATLDRHDGDSVRFMILAREPETGSTQVAPPVLHGVIHADLVNGE